MAELQFEGSPVLVITARLLLVDDDTSALQVMNSMLAEYPDKRFATSGELAMRLAREEAPDLILLDVVMPGMTGFEMFDALKRDPRLANIPVVFVTAHDTEALREAGAPMGAAVFIPKPMVAAQLKEAVRDSLFARA